MLKAHLDAVERHLLQISQFLRMLGTASIEVLRARRLSKSF